jgi:hypothetical protein
MHSGAVTILGSVQVDCASMSVELSNFDGVLLREAHARLNGDKVLGEMSQPPRPSKTGISGSPRDTASDITRVCPKHTSSLKYEPGSWEEVCFYSFAVQSLTTTRDSRPEFVISRRSLTGTGPPALDAGPSLSSETEDAKNGSCHHQDCRIDLVSKQHQQHTHCDCAGFQPRD